MSRSPRTVVVSDISEDEARTIIQQELLPTIDAMISEAHRQGSRGRTVYTERNFRGSLLNAAIRLPDEFENRARAHVSEAWRMGIGYTMIHHAPGTLWIRLK